MQKAADASKGGKCKWFKHKFEANNKSHIPTEFSSPAWRLGSSNYELGKLWYLRSVLARVPGTYKSWNAWIK